MKNLGCILGIHNWKTEKYNKTHLQSFNPYTHEILASGIEGMVVLEKCSRCGEERAYLTDGNERHYKDVLFMKAQNGWDK